MDDKKELKIVISDSVKESMDSDPELAEFMRDFMASMRQADHAVKTGQHNTFDDAIEAITGFRPELVDLDDDGDEEDAT